VPPKITTERVDDAVALRFWQDSPHASVFTHPAVISALADKHDWWLTLKGSSPACLWPVATTESGIVVRPSFSYFVGPMWSSAHSDPPAHRALADQVDVLDSVAAELMAHYGEIHADLPLAIADVRPFEWWNRETDSAPQFAVRPRYTARINHLAGLDDAQIAAGFRECRRREIKNVRARAELQRMHEVSSEQVTRLYCQVLALQGIAPARETLSAISKLCSLVSDGHGVVVAFRRSDSDEPESLVLLLVGRGVANGVLSLTNPNSRRSSLSAWTMYHAILAARDIGADSFDFNGANGARGADDKHSYGASAALYFAVDCPGPS